MYSPDRALVVLNVLILTSIVEAASWENQYKVKLSKKVTVNVNEGKKPVKKPIIQNKIGVKVNVK
jgi:hypothetical protein